MWRCFFAAPPVRNASAAVYPTPYSSLYSEWVDNPNKLFEIPLVLKKYLSIYQTSTESICCVINDVINTLTD